MRGETMNEKCVGSIRGKVFYWCNNLCDKESWAILFCHGLTANHHLFDKQVQELEDKYPIITMDIPLHGKSRPYDDFSYSHVNEDILKILEQENIDKVLLVGQSAGGYIAQAFITEYQEKVVGFVGIGSTPFGSKYYKKSDLFWIKNFTKLAKLYSYKAYIKASVKGVCMTAESKESFRQALTDLGREGMLLASKAVYDEFLAWDVGNYLQIACPVLITYGEVDKVGYVQRYNKAWAEETRFPLRIIKDASHNANYDNYEDFNGLLVEFIQLVIM